MVHGMKLYNTSKPMEERLEQVSYHSSIDVVVSSSSSIDSGKLDWLADKLSSKFVLPGVCWDQSYIPLEIWKVGDSTTNIIESVHAAVNHEGISRSLCAGVTTGKHFDTERFKTLLVLFYLIFSAIHY